MIGQGVARRYAKALFEIGRDSQMLDQLEKDLALVNQTFSEHKEARDVLLHPLIPVEDKAKLVEGLFKDKVAPVALDFVKMLVEKKREGHLGAIFSEFRILVNREKRVVEVKVSVARQPSQALLDSIKEGLTRVAGSKVDLRVDVDPKLIGGMVLRMGDRRIDGSIRNRLEMLREQIREGRISEKR